MTIEASVVQKLTQFFGAVGGEIHSSKFKGHITPLIREGYVETFEIEDIKGKESTVYKLTEKGQKAVFNLQQAKKAFSKKH